LQHFINHDMANEKELTKDSIDAIDIIRADSKSDDVSGANVEKAQEEKKKPMATKRALIAWLVLCFSVGTHAACRAAFSHHL
jgi:hypothetical protein